MAEGNRKDPRARVLNMTVRYKSATVDEFIENHSHDISRGGIFIKTRSPFPAGTLLKFEVRIAEDQKLMHGVGRVVWRREADRAEESFPAGMGIKFIKTGEGAAELINQLILAREGAESSFDAGVREAVSTPGGARPSVVPPAASSPAASSAQPSSPAPLSGPALTVESGPRSVPTEGGTAVTSPAKKRQDLAPEKRKVVLQGPALESPPSKPKPLVTPAASGNERAPNRERPARGSIAEETTSPRVRPASVKRDNQSPKLSGLLVILGLIALVVFVVNRLRGSAAEEAVPAPIAAEPEVTAPAPLPEPAAPAPPVEAALPNEPVPVDPSAPADPNAPAAAEAAAGQPAAGEGVEAAPLDPNAAGAASPAQAVPGSTPPAAGTTAAAPTPAPAASAPAPSAPATATPPPPAPAPAPKAVTPVPAKPAPPKPAPAPPQAAPKPQPAPVAPPSDRAPAPPAAGSAGESSSATPPAKKPPAEAVAPAPPVAPSPASPPPAAPPAAPSDDNPY
jgi:uncharacterized protein (TIGR02266 family)